MKKRQELARIDDLEIEALTDDDLDIVQGAGDTTTAASCECCVAGGTQGIKPPKAI